MKFTGTVGKLGKVGMLVVATAALGAFGCSSSSNGGGTGGGAGSAAAGKGGSAAAGTSGTAGTGGAAGSGGQSAAAGAGGTSAGGAGGTSVGGASGAGGSTAAGGAGGSALCGDDTGTGQGESCSTVVPHGLCVTSTISTGTPTAPSGGTFSLGTYDLTSQTLYIAADAAAPSKVTGRQTLVISNVTSTSLTLEQVEVSGTRSGSSRGTVTISGMTATFTPTCPATDGGQNGGTAEFSASSSSIALFEQTDNGLQVSVYEREL